VTQALTPRPVLPRAARRSIYDAEIIGGLAFCWAVLGASTGKRLAPIMAELVPRLRRFQELVITDDAEPALLATSAATMDRRLAPDRAKLLVRGRSHTKPGSLKEWIPIRTWAEWNDAVPGFVEIDLVGHEVGEHHPRRHLRRVESRGRPPRGPGTDRAAPDRHHQQERTRVQPTTVPLRAHRPVGQRPRPPRMLTGVTG